MTKQSHLKDFVSLSLSLLATPLMALLTSPILARVLGPDGRGAVAAVSAPIALGESLAAFGLPMAATYFVARGQRANVFLRRWVWVAAASGVTTYLLLFFTAPLLLRSHPELVTLLRLAGLYVILTAGIGLMRGVQNGLANYSRLARERWVQGLSRLAAIALFALFGWLTVKSTVWINTITSIAAALMLLRLVTNAKEDVQEPSRRDVLRYSWKSWAGQVGSTLNGRLDQAILIAFVSVGDLGLYAIAATTSELPTMFFLAAQKMVLGGTSAGHRVEAIARLSRLIVPLAVVVAAVSALAAPVLIPAVFGSSFWPAVTLVLVLLVGLVPYGLAQVMLGGLSAVGHPGKSSVAELLGAIVTVVGLFLVAPKYGTLGAAWVSVAAYSVIASYRLHAFHRASSIRYGKLVIAGPEDFAWVAGQVKKAIKRDS